MQTVLVIGVFAAMILAPCILASCTSFLSGRGKNADNGEGDAEAADPMEDPRARKHRVPESPLADPTYTRVR